MKNLRAEKKYNYNNLGLLANMNLAYDIKEMFGAIMDERIAAGKMPAENKSKAESVIKRYIDYIWEQPMKVAYYTLCDLYDYIDNNDIHSALDMVQKNSIVTIVC